MTEPTAPSPAAPASRYGVPRPKVAPFARYKGTSAWRKYRSRVREYARFRAASQKAASAA